MSTQSNKAPVYNGSNAPVGGTSKTCPGPKPKIEESRVKIRYSIFFDGTRNNKFNTEAGQSKSNTHQQENPGNNSDGEQSSYTNDFTNIAKLEKYLQKKSSGFDEHIAAYIEGMGTERNETDSDIGLGFAMGATGIKCRAEDALGNLFNAMMTRGFDGKTIIENLTIDVLGFSRGAATARHFIHLVLADKYKNIKNQLARYNVKIGEVKVRFAGLFDTVSSYGYDQSNDVGELNLKAINLAEKAVHLVAHDEHRENFALTNIKSKGSIEISLPGVHSDIGGGYMDKYNENEYLVLQLKHERSPTKGREIILKEQQRLIDEGWYRKDEFSTDGNPYVLKVTRKGIRNTYSRIPLHIMKKYAADNMLNFSVDIDLHEKIPAEAADLVKIKQILKEDGTGSWQGETELIKRLKHDYFHYSASFGSLLNVNNPRFNPEKFPNQLVRERRKYDG